MVWCATMWALQKTTNRSDDWGRERWENGAKQIVKERKDRRVRLLHTVQHARQNTTSLYSNFRVILLLLQQVRQTSNSRKYCSIWSLKYPYHIWGTRKWYFSSANYQHLNKNIQTHSMHIYNVILLFLTKWKHAFKKIHNIMSSFGNTL